PGSENIVANGSKNVRFHHRNVLVSSRMEDPLDALQAHDLGQPCGVANVAERGYKLEARILLAQLVFYAKQIALRLVEGHEGGGGETRHLAAELGADRARSAGHQNGTASKAVANGRLIQFDGLTPKQILHGYVPHLGGQNLSAEELIDSGKSLARNPRGTAVG